jgi:hypothetical protein
LLGKDMIQHAKARGPSKARRLVAGSS